MSSHNTEESNPGSFNDFTDRLGIDPSTPEAILRHGEALSAYRQALAAEHNMSLEELHSSFGRHATLESITAA